jgi:hypothetical protein
MLTIMHIEVDGLEGDLAFDIAGPPNSDRPVLAARLLREGHYRAVAECDLLPSAAGLEMAWTMTQNGVLTDSWSRKPPSGLRPLEPSVIIESGRVYGRRSSMVGDVIEYGTTREADGAYVAIERHVVDWMGFKPVPMDDKAKEAA